MSSRIHLPTAILMLAFCGFLLFAPTAGAGSAASACSAMSEEPTCCACNSGGDCIEVEHNGVASCTFEFCSSTPCTYH